MASSQRIRGPPSSVSSDDDLIDIQHTGTTNSDIAYGADGEILENSNNPNKSTGWQFGEEIPGLGQYDDFHTIDWQRDIARDRMRHRHIVKKKKESFCDMIRGAHDAWSGWLVVLLVGILSGMVAGIVDIGATWLTDIKLGICPTAFYLNKEQCCWSSEEVVVDISGNCSLWLSWSEVFGKGKLGAGTSPYIISYISYMAVAILFAALSASLVRMFAPYACGSGIPEIKTILSGFIIRGYLGKWTFLIKAVAIMLAVAAGLSLGKEGPMVHMACCTGNILSYLFPKYGRNEAKKREVLSAASAAGVAIAFGAPIGGVMFSLEEVSYYFPLKTLWRSFFCALVAAFVLQSINPFGNDHSVLFYVEYNTPWMFFELIPFLLLGVIGGLVGVAFIRANIAWCKFRKSSKLGQYPVTEVLFVALATAVLAFPNPYTRMNASELIYLLYSKCGVTNDQRLCERNSSFMYADDQTHTDESGSNILEAMSLLIFAFVFKLIATVFTFGIKVPSGLFIPSLCMGAIIGRIMGIGLKEFLKAYHDSLPILIQAQCSHGSCITPGLYSMVGSAAVLGGVTRMTVSLVVIMFEVTGGVRYIVPLMTACMTSKWIGDAIGRTGIYDAHIHLNGYPFLDIKEEFDHPTLARDVMQPNGKGGLQVLTQDSETVRNITDLLCQTDYNGFPIVLSNESKLLVGYVSKRDLKIAIHKAKTENFAIDEDSLILFTKPVAILDSDIKQPPPLIVEEIVDFCPNCITDKTPMEIVINNFSKLGLRQTLVTQKGRLQGIITKKDVLKHIQKMKHEK